MELNKKSEENKTKLCKTTVWTRFTTILGFIVSSILVFLVGFIFFFIGAIDPLKQIQPIQDMPYNILKYLWLLFVLIAVVKVFFHLKKFKFSHLVKQFLFKNEEQQSVDGIGRLFKFYRFIGILTISLFVLYLVLLLVMFQVGSYNIAG